MANDGGSRKLSSFRVRCSCFSSNLDDAGSLREQTDHVGPQEEPVSMRAEPAERGLVIEYVAHCRAFTVRQEEVVVIESSERASHQ